MYYDYDLLRRSIITQNLGFIIDLLKNELLEKIIGDYYLLKNELLDLLDLWDGFI